MTFKELFHFTEAVEFMCTELLMEFYYYPFRSYVSVVLFPLPFLNHTICVFSFLMGSRIALYQFYWTFQRTCFWFYWFFFSVFFTVGDCCWVLQFIHPWGDKEGKTSMKLTLAVSCYSTFHFSSRSTWYCLLVRDLKELFVFCAEFSAVISGRARS